MTTSWGIAGAGKISHDFVVALRTLPEKEHQVIAVAAQDLSRAQNFAKTHNIKIAYNQYAKLAENKEIDIVYVGTLNHQHFDIVKIMLNNGKHVLCEKPLTINYKQTKELINLAKSKKLFLMEAIWSRCFPVYDAIRKEIKSGNLGNIHQVIVPFGFNLTSVERLTNKSLSGGTILDLGVYTLQFACLVFDDEEPETIKATGCLNKNGVDLSMSATLVYKGSRTATIITNGLVELTNEACIMGTKGMIRVPNFWCPPKVDLPSGSVDIPLPEPHLPLNYKNSTGLRYEAMEARACIQKGLIESSKISHNTSLLIAKLEDELRKQLGVVYPEDTN